MTLIQVTKTGSRLEQLQMLAETLASEIDLCDDCKSMAQLARQYRETIREIEELKGMTDGNDEISEILSQRKADGKSGAVRKSRT